MSMPSESAAEYRSHYNDGQSAASHAVLVYADDAGLAVTGDDGRVVDRWAWDDIRYADPPAGNRPVRLSNRAKSGARLTIEDAALLPIVRAQARYLTRDPVTRRRVWTVVALLAAATAVILFFVYGLPWVARPAAALVPIAWEEPVGESTVNVINELFARGRKLCSDPAGQAALQSLTRKLTAVAQTPYDIRVDVVNADVVNALAAPGGRIVIFRGLIDRATSADEVAGVLAHEIAHVIRRHPTQGMFNSIGWSALLSVFTGGASLSNTAVARLAAHLATSAHTRELESEADEGAVAMLDKSGIGTAGLAHFFESLKRLEKNGPQLPEYLSSHPQTNKRIEMIESEASKPRTPALSPAEWQALKAICR